MLGGDKMGWRGRSLDGAGNVCKGLEGLEFRGQGGHAQGFRGGAGDTVRAVNGAVGEARLRSPH